MSDAMRTPSGAPSQTAREQHGDKEGKYPIFDHKSAHSALMLRGHSPDPAKVIARVRAWANEHGDKAILAECDAATEADKKPSSGNRADLLTALGVETRSGNVTVDDVDFPRGIISVIAVPYEQTAKIPFAGEVWNEVFSRTAFDNFDPGRRRVPATASLTVPNPNHEKGHLVGRIVEARSTDVGLVTDVKISRTDAGTETLELANDHMLSASVGFLVKDPRRDQELDRHTRTRRIHRAFLDHLAFVGSPAYDGATVLSVRGGPDLPIVDTPCIDDWVNDPIVAWSNDRVKH